MIVELQGKMVERVYAVPVDTVEEIVFKGRQTRADELILAKSREDVIKALAPSTSGLAAVPRKNKEKGIK